jgi:hypothetical protein
MYSCGDLSVLKDAAAAHAAYHSALTRIAGVLWALCRKWKRLTPRWRLFCGTSEQLANPRLHLTSESLSSFRVCFDP